MSGMAECQSTVDKALEEIICPLCMSVFSNPRSLRCLHSYCESCIEQLVRSAQGSTVTCPECRTETVLDHQGVSGLALNFKLQRFVDIIRNDTEITSSSSGAAASTQEPPTSRCRVHPDKELEYYCEECRALICGKCMLEGHRSHDGVKYATDAVDEHFKMLTASVAPLNRSLSDSASVLGDLRTDLADIRAATDEARVTVRNYFTRVHNLLKTRETALMEEISSSASECENSVGAHQKAVQSARTVVLQCVERVKALEGSTSQLQTLMAEDDLLSTMEESREQLDLAIVNVKIKGGLSFQSPFHTDLYFEAQCSVVGENPYQKPESVSEEDMVPPLRTRPVPPSPRVAGSLRSDPRRAMEESPYITLQRGASEPLIQLPRRYSGSGSYGDISPPSWYQEDLVLPCLEVNGRQLLGPTPRTAAVYPHAVGVGRPDLLVVVDSRNNNMILLTPTGKYLDRVEIEGRSDGSVMEPRAVCTGQDGSIFVVVKGAGSKIRKYSSAGKLLSTIKSKALGNLTGITVLPNDQLLVTDAHKKCVHVFEGSGKSSGKLDIIDSEKPEIPSDITHDLRGNIIVADEGPHCVRVYSSNGRYLSTFGRRGSAPGELLNPQGVAADLHGNVFVADTGNHRVSVFTVSGRFVSCFGGKGSDPGQFLFPRHLCLDSLGRLVVADEQNQRLQIFDVSDHANN